LTDSNIKNYKIHKDLVTTNRNLRINTLRHYKNNNRLIAWNIDNFNNIINKLNNFNFKLESDYNKKFINNVKLFVDFDSLKIGMIINVLIGTKVKTYVVKQTTIEEVLILVPIYDIYSPSDKVTNYLFTISAQHYSDLCIEKSMNMSKGFDKFEIVNNIQTKIEYDLSIFKTLKS